MRGTAKIASVVILEDPRLRVMYWKLFLSKMERMFSGSGQRNRRAGTVTGLVITLLVMGAVIAFFENHTGDYTKLKSHLATPKTQDAAAPQPGGQDPIVLTRSPLPGSLVPEFLSVTLLPGRGMDVLSIRASLPDKGEVDLLAGGGLDDATKAMTGMDDDAAGEANLTHGGTFLVPWAGRLGGIPSMDGKSVSVSWRGRILNIPANTVESGVPTTFGGLLMNLPSSGVEVNPMPDGGYASATFAGTDFDGRWPAKMETKITALMSSRAMDLTVDVKNVGDVAAPVGIGWAPRFLIPSGDRAKATLRMTAAAHSEVRDQSSGMPTGRLEPVAGTVYDFNGRNGVPLGQKNLNTTFTQLKAPLDEDPTMELRDPEAKFGLRIRAMTPTIRAIHVYSPANSNFVSISPQTNFDDPFGREWGLGENTGMTALEPGQSVQWKIRIELFPLTNLPGSPL